MLHNGKADMDENSNKIREQFFQIPESADVEQTELRKLSKEELKNILENHKKWLESEGKEGKKAELEKTNLIKADLKHANLRKASMWRADLRDSDLGQADLREANLSKANLQRSSMGFANLRAAVLDKANLKGAYLVGADLQGAYLGGADLRGVNLMEANLREADLSEAVLEKAHLFDTELNASSLFDTNFNYVNLTNAKGLKEAKLQYANFEKTTGLLGTELMQTDITGTKLPANYSAFNTLQVIEETSRNARKIFFAMILGCVYSWLTIATTTDVNLLTNSASSPLPIIGTEIPIAWFYWASPLVIMCLYLYFHFYLNGLWEALSELPAIFPDGKRLDERAYPWLLNKLVRRHFLLLRTNRPLIARQQEWVIIFLGWWVVPLTFIGFWLRYLPRHDWLGTSLHIFLLIISIGAALSFYRLALISLRGILNRKFLWSAFWKHKQFYFGLAVIVAGTIFSMLSYNIINGERYGELIGVDEELDTFKKVVPLVFKMLGYTPFANFSEKDVSERPQNYWEISPSERIESIKGAKLHGSNLRYADMSNSFLVRADLRKSNLEHAYLSQANLQKADLSEANLTKAILLEANFKQTKLWNANLKEANLSLTNFENANLELASLEGARLHKAIFQSTNLKHASFSKAEVIGSDFTRANLDKASLLEADLRQSYFQNAKLTEAKLRGANLQQANLVDALLEGSNFEGADLRGVVGLTVEQLCEAKTLYNALLEKDIEKKIFDACPMVLEKPDYLKNLPTTDLKYPTKEGEKKRKKQE